MSIEIENLERDELRKFVLEGMPKKNDYSILEGNDLEIIVDALIDMEADYMANIEPDETGAYEYNDEDAFDAMSEALKEAFPQYKTFCEAMVDDYMDLSEEFLTKSGSIDWE